MPTMSVGVGMTLFVCPQHNSKSNDSKVYKLGIGNGTFGYPRNDIVLGLKGHSVGLGLG